MNLATIDRKAARAEDQIKLEAMVAALPRAGGETACVSDVTVAPRRGVSNRARATIKPGQLLEHAGRLDWWIVALTTSIAVALAAATATAPAQAENSRNVVFSVAENSAD